ncbi:hypothetical protein E2C01_007676 [Portunus trituberculatus]|uniref:Uncharacterized protein n=1 Tax=Portunus trituberculatus TaxID=210409 RepID=A0A5B7D0B1_PORTR|nr:hypothetical protein [Portunus trituberculatus]
MSKGEENSANTWLSNKVLEGCSGDLLMLVPRSGCGIDMCEAWPRSGGRYQDISRVFGMSSKRGVGSTTTAENSVCGEPARPSTNEGAAKTLPKIPPKS